jgi:shikimate kinase
MKRDKIYLVGFAASGKSTVARLLAARLGWRHFDVDELIQQREGRDLKALFAELGEAHFRSAEREVVSGLLEPRHAVVATGSGTFVDPVSRARMAADGVVVWLDARFETLLSRLPAGHPRPLGDDRIALQRAYEARSRVYRLADLRVDADLASAGEVVERLLDWLGY